MTLYTLNNKRLKNDLFSSYMNDYHGNERLNETHHLPKANIVENKADFRIELSAPGFKKEHFELKLDKNILIVKGNQETEKANERKYALREFSTQSFIRRFSLPKNINEESINAMYEDGILILTIPKKEEVKPEPRTISIS